MNRIIRFVIGYVMYATVVLGYAYHLLTHPAGYLFGPSAPALTVLTAVALALPVLDANWNLLNKHFKKTVAAVFIIGVLTEVVVRGNLSAETLLGAGMKLLIYLIVVTIATMLYLMAYPRRSTSNRNSNVTN